MMDNAFFLIFQMLMGRCDLMLWTQTPVTICVTTQNMFFYKLKQNIINLKNVLIIKKT